MSAPIPGIEFGFQTADRLFSGGGTVDGSQSGTFAPRFGDDSEGVPSRWLMVGAGLAVLAFVLAGRK